MRKAQAIILLFLFCSVALLAAAGFLNTDKLQLNSWMSLIDGSAHLTDIAMPGSHDAGTYECFVWDKTQHLSIAEQLESGTRYFDLRVDNSLFNDFGNYENLRMYHGLTSPTTFYSVLLEIRDFVECHPTEFLILDFQHFRNEPYIQMLELIEEHLSPEYYALKNPVDIASLTLGEIRAMGARYMIAWGDFDSLQAFDKQYLFYRRDVLSSPYINPYHTTADEYLIEQGFEHYYAGCDDRLFVLQSQKTGVFADFDTMNPQRNEESFSPKANAFLRSLRSGGRLSDTNIVMRDFIDEEKSKLIISLNLSKNLVKPNSIRAFSALVKSSL